MTNVQMLFAASSEAPQTFDTFWATFPRRVAKLDAKRAYDKALKLATATEIIAGAQRYAAATSRTEMQFIKHPATWLRGGGWLDDIEAISGSAQPRRGLGHFAVAIAEEEANASHRQVGPYADDIDPFGGLPRLGGFRH